MKKWFNAPGTRETVVSYTIALLLGAVVFHILYDIPLFLNLFWGADIPNDLTQHITGFYALRNSPWGFPLLYTRLLGHPEGISVFFTDSIPLLAVPFKLISPLLPADFHYFKLWIFAAFLLQPVAAVTLIRSLGHHQPASAFFAAAFSLLVKWLIFRIPHPALTGQFLILFALALYIQQTRWVDPDRFPRRIAVKWIALILVTFLVHSYLFAMVFGIFAASVLDFRLRDSYKLPALLRKGNLLLLPCLMFPILYGLFISTTTFTDLQPADGYSYFSLNLTGPIYGGNLIHFPTELGPKQGQFFEDQSYLGLGVIGLLVTGLALGIKNLLPAIKKHPFLILALIGFYLFAVTTDVYLGTQRIYRYPEFITRLILNSPLSQFRASARFFWPVGYALIFFSLATVLKKRWIWPLLAALLVLQWVDLPKPYTPRPAGYADAYNPDLPYWDGLLAGKRALYLYPTFFCGGETSPVHVPVLMMAVKNGVTSNTVSTTRYTEDCDQKVSDGLADISAGTVHIFAAPGNEDTQNALSSMQPDWCSSHNEITLCIPYPSESDREQMQQLGGLQMRTSSPVNLLEILE